MANERRNKLLGVVLVVFLLAVVGSAVVTNLGLVGATVGPYDVGVIPQTAGQCPAGSEYITIYMDDEDNSNISSMSGWTGATSQPYSTHVDGTRLGFCRVNGLLFYNLGHANLINWFNAAFDPQKTSVASYSYSLLKLGSYCPNGSVDYTVIIDNENTNNQNSSTGNISPNIVKHGLHTRTALYFCLFTPSSGSSMTDFPPIGITYGVFAGASVPPTGLGHRNYWLATGSVFTDDEDFNNQDGIVDPGFSHDDFEASGGSVTPGPLNTMFYMAKVQNKIGNCSQPVSWWDGSQVHASFDSANCFVRSAPSGSQPFVWANKYYIKPTPTHNCPLGSFTAVGCFVMIKPPGAFISNNAFYVLPGSGNTCPSAPSGWTFSGNYCVLAVPWDIHAFQWPPFSGVKSFYTTTLPTCQDGSFDGANCYMGTPPAGSNAFVYANNFYYTA
jgi:hypothetical protein